MTEIINRLMAACPGAKPTYFEASGWFDDVEKGNLDPVIREYEVHYNRRLDELKKHQPAVNGGPITASRQAP